jgi:AcrR family transcriptional regulator
MSTDVFQPHPDRRQRKSRAALQQAFLQVTAVKPYEAITIEDITDAADLTRATFYAHYTDKAELTREVYEHLIDDLKRQIPDISIHESDVYTAEAVAVFFEHARENANLYRLAITGAAGVEPQSMLVAAFEKLVTEAVTVRSQYGGKTARAPMALFVGTFVASLLSTVNRWLDGRLEGSPGEVATAFVLVQMRGIEWASGFDPGELRYEAQSG